VNAFRVVHAQGVERAHDGADAGATHDVNGQTGLLYCPKQAEVGEPRGPPPPNTSPQLVPVIMRASRAVSSA